MILADGSGVILELFRSPQFCAAVAKAFPEVSKLDDISDGAHIALSALGERVRQALESNEESKVIEIFEFVERILERDDLHPEISEAVGQSFVGPGTFKTTEMGRRAWNKAPKRLFALMASGEDQ